MKVLAIKGGGVRGYLAAKLGARLDRRMPDWDEEVDVFAGVSAGALIAFGRAAGVPWPSLVKLYRTCARRVFSAVGFAAAPERAAKLREVLTDVFEDRRLAELDRNVLAISVQSDQGRWTPRFWTRQRDGAAKVVDVLLATTAAPLYFPAHHGHVDGGLLMNDPSLAALMVASGGAAKLMLEVAFGQVSVLTLGCGRVSRPRDLVEAVSHGGLLGPLADAIKGLGELHHELDPRLTEDVPLDGGEDLEESLAVLSDTAKSVNLRRTGDWLEDRGW